MMLFSEETAAFAQELGVTPDDLFSHTWNKLQPGPEFQKQQEELLAAASRLPEQYQEDVRQWIYFTASAADGD